MPPESIWTWSHPALPVNHVTCIPRVLQQLHSEGVTIPVRCVVVSALVTVLTMWRSWNRTMPPAALRSEAGRVSLSTPLMVILGSLGCSTITTASMSGMVIHVSSPKHLEKMQRCEGLGRAGAGMIQHLVFLCSSTARYQFVTHHSNEENLKLGTLDHPQMIVDLSTPHNIQLANQLPGSEVGFSIVTVSGLHPEKGPAEDVCCAATEETWPSTGAADPGPHCCHRVCTMFIHHSLVQRSKQAGQKRTTAKLGGLKRPPGATILLPSTATQGPGRWQRRPWMSPFTLSTTCSTWQTL